MKYLKILLAWCILGVLVYGGYTFAHTYKNPFSAGVASPVIDALPAASTGCGERCKYD